jgi:signal transduction histidine kinase
MLLAMTSNTGCEVYGRTFESAADPMVVVGAEGAFLGANRAAREAGLIEDAVRQVALREPRQADIRLVDRTGTARVFVPSEQRIDGMHVLTYRDVTALRAAEDALAQCRRIESLGYVTASAVHDFNNMLTPILCASALLATGATEATREGQLALEIREAAERSAELIRALMAFVRKRPPLVQRVDVNAALTALRRLLVRALPENVELELALSSTPLHVTVDKSRFESAIVNLVLNARDAMPRGGKIVVRTGLEQGPIGQSVRVVVTDDGHGMSPEVRTHALDRFFTTKAPGRGTGLGLPAVQAFVLAAGGHLSIQSQIHGGTEVRLYLPHGEGPVEPVDVGAERLRGGSEKIVLVEEDQSASRSMRTVLEELGYNVVESPWQNVVLQLVNGGDVDLVVVDRAFRGAGGMDLARSILAAAPRTRVLVLDGHPAQILGEDEHLDLPILSKPIDRVALLEKVRSVLDAKLDS